MPAHAPKAHLDGENGRPSWQHRSATYQRFEAATSARIRQNPADAEVTLSVQLNTLPLSVQVSRTVLASSNGKAVKCRLVCATAIRPQDAITATNTITAVLSPQRRTSEPAAVAVESPGTMPSRESTQSCVRHLGIRKDHCLLRSEGWVSKAGAEMQTEHVCEGLPGTVEQACQRLARTCAHRLSSNTKPFVINGL